MLKNLSFLKFLILNSLQIHFLFPLTILELQSYTLFYRVFVREKDFSKEGLWSFDHQEILVFVIEELGTPV